MNIYLGFMVMALVSWRIVNLIVNEDGPWDVFQNARIWARKMCREHKWCEEFGFNMLFECEYCNSMYVCTVLAFGYTYLTHQAWYWSFAYSLAWSTCVIFLKWAHQWLRSKAESI